MPGRNHGRSVRRPTTNFTRDIIGSNNIPFQLLNEIGHGGYGSVWRARNLYASRETGIYAVKVLRRAKPGSHHHAFHYREVVNHKLVAPHPNIATMYGVIQDKENLYLVMDYCPGGTLLDLILKERAFARNDAFLKGMFLQLIDAVDFCHKQGVYHRDIKPENILLNRERNKLFLTDFGLSTRTRESQCFGTGSKNYMSPGLFTSPTGFKAWLTSRTECLNRTAPSYNCQRSDIWALGVILMNMISGRSPWLLASLHDQCFNLYLRSRTYLRDRFPISKAADHILGRILTPNPSMSIELEELRALVQKVDTFFMSDGEIAGASDTVRLVAQYLGPAMAEPVGPAEDNNPPSEGLPIFVILSSTSDDVPSSDSDETDSEPESGSQSEDREVPRVLRVRNVVPLAEDSSAPDEELGWRRGAKTPAAAALAPPPIQPGSAEVQSPPVETSTSSSSEQGTLSTGTTSNSSGGVRSFFGLFSRPQKKDASAPASSTPPSNVLASRRLSVQLRRVFNIV